MSAPVPSRFRIVPRDVAVRRRGTSLLLGLAWLASLGAVWFVASHTAAPRLAQADAARVRAEQALQAAQAEARTLRQRESTLARSDQISRAANAEVQDALAERDEEIAALRADVAFYERLVGSTAQRKGLNVHSIEFTPTDAGSWNYRAVLTQNLNRGAISQGQLRFSVEGVRGGKLATLGWDELHNTTGTPGQDYSFRYFQELGGNVMLPKDFTPQRVRVSLRGASGSVEQNFDWKPAAGGGSR